MCVPLQSISVFKMYDVSDSYVLYFMKLFDVLKFKDNKMYFSHDDKDCKFYVSLPLLLNFLTIFFYFGPNLPPIFLEIEF